MEVFLLSLLLHVGIEGWLLLRVFGHGALDGITRGLAS